MENHMPHGDHEISLEEILATAELIDDMGNVVCQRVQRHVGWWRAAAAHAARLWSQDTKTLGCQRVSERCEIERVAL